MLYIKCYESWPLFDNNLCYPDTSFQFRNFKNKKMHVSIFPKMSELKMRLRPNPRKKNKNTKYGSFHCSYALFKKNFIFSISKWITETLYLAISMQIWLFRCLSEGVFGCQYALNFKNIWIWSEDFFNNFWNLQQ